MPERETLDSRRPQAAPRQMAERGRSHRAEPDHRDIEMPAWLRHCHVDSFALLVAAHLTAALPRVHYALTAAL